jgi:hypothetical protein
VASIRPFKNFPISAPAFNNDIKLGEDDEDGGLSGPIVAASFREEKYAQPNRVLCILDE